MILRKQRERFFWFRKRLYWRLRRTPEPIHPKCVMILAHQLETRIGVFVETGTHFGGMAEAVAPFFGAVHTVENDPWRVWHARVRLKRFPNVHCHEGDSAVVLPKLLKDIVRPAIIWIDAHADVPDAEGTQPLRTEMAALAGCDVRHHIFIDDARLLEHWIDKSYFQSWCNEMRGKAYEIQCRDDVWRILPKE
jgi:hypothetical protein